MIILPENASFIEFIDEFMAWDIVRPKILDGKWMSSKVFKVSYFILGNIKEVIINGKELLKSKVSLK